MSETIATIKHDMKDFLLSSTLEYAICWSGILYSNIKILTEFQPTTKIQGEVSNKYITAHKSLFDQYGSKILWGT